MKVLKLGSLPSEDIFRGTCTYCKTEFECKRHEGKYVDNWRDGGYLKVTCPVCTREASAYKRDDGQLIPSHRRSTWNSTAQQIAAIEAYGVVDR